MRNSGPGIWLGNLGCLVVICLCFALVAFVIDKWRVSSIHGTDETLVNRVTSGLEKGNFLGDPDAVKSLSTLFYRGHKTAKTPQTTDCLVTTGALLLTDAASWTDSKQGRPVYNLIKDYDHKLVIDSLARKVTEDNTNRLRVLFLCVKLGIPGSEERLNEVLNQHGDIRMAEDFLNSGSPTLYRGGAQWATSHGYSVQTGKGSHRASWGKF